MYAIEAIGLRKRFRNKGKDATQRWTQAVDGIDLRIDEGDICALLGPNGAGKTTTLMMLLGVTEPDEGTVSLLGHKLPEGRTRALEQTNFSASYIGMPYRVRVREILDVYTTLYGARPDRAREVMELLGISEFLDRYTSQLSSGQRTLVGLTKALLSEPRLLVLDEPTASLDPEVAERVRKVLRDEHARRQITVLVTSHNMADIERLCRRVVFVAKGRVVADGSPAEIAAHYGVDDLEQTFLSIATQSRESTEVRR
jgi:ABC-2 type transport system ATP-binding protein